MLLLKVAAGDETAFGQLFKLYYNQLGEFIMRITESEPLTQDIVQEVFLKIWIKRKSLAELDWVFREIHRKTGYQFFYQDEILKQAKKFDISVKDASVEEVLELCFK